MDAVRAARAIAREYRASYMSTEDHIESRVYSSIAEAFDTFATVLETGKGAYVEEEDTEPVLRPRPDTGPKGDPALQRPYGARRDVGKHIASAFANVPVGTVLTIDEIAAHRSEEYGADHPARGAIAARLFPAQDGSRCTVPGVNGTVIGNPHVGGYAKRGGVKVA